MTVAQQQRLDVIRFELVAALEVFTEEHEARSRAQGAGGLFRSNGWQKTFERLVGVR